MSSAPAADPAVAYRDTRRRVTDLVRDLSTDRAAGEVPATPEWRVKDVLAHLIGVSADIVNGNLEGVATDQWTAKQVADRRERSIPELLAEWDEHAPAVEAMIPAFPEVPRAMLMADVATHEEDLRGALGHPGSRDSVALALGFEWFAGNPKVGFETDAGAFPGEDAAPTVRATRFELFRASTGRRSLDQIAAYDWVGEPRPDLIVGPIFTPRITPLEE